jgi:hypothetical protein
MALREGLHGDGRPGVAVGDPPPGTTTRPRDGAHAAAPRRYGLGLPPRPERAHVDSVSSGRLSALRWPGPAGPRPAHIRLIDRRSRRATPSARWALRADAHAPPLDTFPLDTVIPYQGQVSNSLARQLTILTCPPTLDSLTRQLTILTCPRTLDSRSAQLTIRTCQLVQTRRPSLTSSS